MKKRILPLLLLVIAAASCKKDKESASTTAPAVATGVYVLSEGLFNNNNSTLTYYDFSTGIATTDFYAKANGSGLGDTGNDILIYGGKVYTVVNVSSYVDVSNVYTAKNIAKIAFKTTANIPRQPRYIIAYKNKVLVSAWDGTVAVIDTTTLSIEKNIAVGANPEQMAVVGDKLFVANSGGLNPTPDSTLSVVSLSTWAELQKIVVGVNPGSVTADDAGNVYVGCTGDYLAIGPKLVKINTANNAIVKKADTAVGKIRFYNGSLYATGGYLGVANVRALSTTDFSQKSANFVTDGTTIVNPYGLNINPDNGDVYVTDAKDYISSGEVFCFDKNGKKKFSFSVTPGLNPNTVVFVKK
ncbi:MAG: YncE family protein [Bacteroidetes bacterium]|nr:YncE family protein [Bacteroidota bacterium]